MALLSARASSATGAVRARAISSWVFMNSAARAVFVGARTPWNQHPETDRPAAVPEVACRGRREGTLAPSGARDVNESSARSGRWSREGGLTQSGSGTEDGFFEPIQFHRLMRTHG